MPEHSRGDVDDSAIASETENHDGDRQLQDLCASLHARIAAFLESDVTDGLLKRVQEQTRITMAVLEDSLRRYSLDELSISYNGGKDCLVLLVLYLAALHAHYSCDRTTTATPTVNTTPFPSQLTSIYIQPPHPFDEVTDFVISSSAQYHLSLASSTKPMKAAFAEYLQSSPEVKAIFVGTRRTDPHGARLTHFDPTDSGWPPFMRMHPVIDWHYQEIWGFIKHFGIPYCSLYDKGYTSLGGTNDTHPNPKLRTTKSGAQGKDEADTAYRPAYELTEDDEERLGRDW